MATTRVQLPDGNIGEFPATMKPEEIESVLAKQFPPTSQPPPSMAQKFQGAVDKASQTEPIDTSHGVGGMAKSVANDLGAGATRMFMSPIAHPLETLKSGVKMVGAAMGNPSAISDMAQNSPIESISKNPGGEAVAAIPQLALAPFGGEEASAARLTGPEGGAAGAIGRTAYRMGIPTRSGAGKLFESVMADAKDQPIAMTRSSEPLMRAFDLSQRGAQLPKVIRQLAQRATTPNAPPLTYQEGRDFASNLSRMSGKDITSLTPVMRAQVGKVSHAFNADVGDAAAAAGRAEDYTKAMRDYRRAAQINSGLKTAAKIAIPTAIGGGIASKILSRMAQ